MTFDEVYTRYYDLISFVLRKMNVPESDRLDLLQDTFVRFLNHQGEVESGKEKSYLCVTARNLALDFFGKQKRRKTEVMGEPIANQQACLWESEPERDTQIEMVRSVLDEHRRVTGSSTLHMFYVEGKSTVKIAEEIGVKESSVRAQLSRQRKSLNQRIVAMLSQATSLV